MSQHEDKAMSDDAALIRASAAYFRKPDPLGLAGIGNFLCGEPSELLRRALLVLQSANSALDDELRALIAILADKGRPVACHAGCKGCCSQLVLCHPFEAVLVARHLASCPSILATFEANFPLWDAATAPIRDDYLRWGTLLYRDGIDDGSHRQGDYSMPCPFLDEGGKCLIYFVRPYACRSLIAIDPECAAPLTPGELAGSRSTLSSLSLPHHKARIGMVSMLMDILDLGPRSTPLPLAVRHFLDQGGL